MQVELAISTLMILRGVVPNIPVTIVSPAMLSMTFSIGNEQLAYTDLTLPIT